MPKDFDNRFYLAESFKNNGDYKKQFHNITSLFHSMKIIFRVIITWASVYIKLKIIDQPFNGWKKLIKSIQIASELITT